MCVWFEFVFFVLYCIFIVVVCCIVLYWTVLYRCFGSVLDWYRTVLCCTGLYWYCVGIALDRHWMGLYCIVWYVLVVYCIERGLYCSVLYGFGIVLVCIGWVLYCYVVYCLYDLLWGRPHNITN